MPALPVNFSSARLVDSLLAGLMPWCCVLCDARGEGFDLCAACLDDLPWLGPAAPPPPCRCIAAVAYAPPADRLITALKFHGRVAHGRVLGELLAIVLRERARAGRLAGVDCVIPVPLGRARQRRRGYNQADLIATVVCRELQLPLAARTLVRTRATAPQMTLARSARAANLQNAFALRRPVKGLRIALVDDVLTTGATFDACAGVLHAGGAVAVEKWVVARTLPLRSRPGGHRGQLSNV